MRTLVLLGWLMVPVVFGRLSLRARARRSCGSTTWRESLAEADRLAAAEQWQAASTRYERGPGAAARGPGRRCPPHPAQTRQGPDVRPPVARGQRRAPGSGRPDAGRQDRPTRSSATRPARPWPTSQYYMTWLMRLEGLSADEWEPEIESARQTYRLLAEQAEAAGDQDRPASIARISKAPSGWPGSTLASSRDWISPSSARAARAASARSPASKPARSPEGRREEGRPQRWRGPPAG